MDTTFSEKLYGSYCIHPLWPPQPIGSILEVIHFSIKINSIIKCLNIGIDNALYVDNLMICYRSKSIHIIEHQLQLNVDKINGWATNNSFRFSKSKTQCVYFCSLGKMLNDLAIKLEGTKISIVDEYKFL